MRKMPLWQLCRSSRCKLRPSLRQDHVTKSCTTCKL
jgi:hypothetical protein